MRAAQVDAQPPVLHTVLSSARARCTDDRRQIAVVWEEALLVATTDTRVRLGVLEVNLTDLVPALRLKHSRHAFSEGRRGGRRLC